MSKTYGYARVSSRDQREDRQVIALNSFGVDQIFVDQQSGKNFDRPQYKKLLRKIKANDVIVVKSINRLGRNYTEILEQWRVITKESVPTSSFLIWQFLILAVTKISSRQVRVSLTGCSTAE